MTLTGTVMPVLMVLLGIALIVRSVTEGAGPAAIGVLVGLLFVAAGAGRLYVERRDRG